MIFDTRLQGLGGSEEDVMMIWSPRNNVLRSLYTTHVMDPTGWIHTVSAVPKRPVLCWMRTWLMQ